MAENFTAELNRQIRQLFNGDAKAAAADFKARLIQERADNRRLRALCEAHGIDHVPADVRAALGPDPVK